MVARNRDKGDAKDRPATAGDPELDGNSWARPFDLSVLAGLVGDDPDVQRKLIGKFTRTAGSTIDAIHKASGEDLAEEVGRLAHKLKSSARTMGANELGDLCESLEKAGKSGDRAGIDGPVARLDGLFIAIERHVASLWTNSDVVANRGNEEMGVRG